MSKKNNKKVNLKSSILLLLVMAILLTSSTYAWFTANKTVRVSTLDVNVEAKNGLQISSDGTTWKTVLANEDISPDALYASGTGTYTSNKNQIPETMEPVSTVGEIDTDGTMKMYYGSVLPDEDGDYALVATKETDKRGTTGKYIAFDVFLKVETTTSLMLTTNSKVEYVGELDKGLQNASRVAFCLEGTVPTGSDLADIQGLNSAVSHGAVGSTTYIWEPNSDVHSAAAVANAKDTYGITTSQTAADAIEYWGIKAGFEESIKLAATHGDESDADIFTKVAPDYVTAKTQADNTNIFTLNAGITKVRVYMWIEGQDVDCENSASGSDIAYSLEFTAI